LRIIKLDIVSRFFYQLVFAILSLLCKLMDQLEACTLAIPTVNLCWDDIRWYRCKHDQRDLPWFSYSPAWYNGLESQH